MDSKLLGMGEARTLSLLEPSDYGMDVVTMYFLQSSGPSHSMHSSSSISAMLSAEWLTAMQRVFSVNPFDFKAQIEEVARETDIALVGPQCPHVARKGDSSCAACAAFKNTAEFGLHLLPRVMIQPRNKCT